MFPSLRQRKRPTETEDTTNESSSVSTPDSTPVEYALDADELASELSEKVENLEHQIREVRYCPDTPEYQG